MCVLKKIAVVMLDVATWTGRKVLSEKDREKLGLPRTDAVTVGQKRIIDPADVAVFQTLRKRAERECLKVGTRFLGGYAVPLDRVDELLTKLREVKEEFDHEAATLKATVHDRVSEWVGQHSEVRDIFTDVRSLNIQPRMHFRYHAITVMPVDGDEETERRASQLGNGLLREIAVEAERFWENSLKGRTTVTQRALRPLRAMRDKLEGLSFVDPRASRLAGYIESILDKMPKTGPLDETSTAILAGLSLTLARGDGAVPETAEPTDAVEDEPTTENPVEESDHDMPKVANGWF